tara:strand:+ start:845 stop:973 length:129 start_codon:yes stop_codon:yes gene_type:complete
MIEKRKGLRFGFLSKLALDVFEGAVDSQHVEGYDGHGYGDVG